MQVMKRIFMEQNTQRDLYFSIKPECSGKYTPTANVSNFIIEIYFNLLIH